MTLVTVLVMVLVLISVLFLVMFKVKIKNFARIENAVPVTLYSRVNVNV